MKKFLILFLLLCIACIGYSDTLNVRVIVNSMDIVSPDGDVKTYTVAEDVPDIPYSSKIIANGMLILNYHSAGIVLKNRQGLFVSKHPITNVLMFSKIENSRSGPILIYFNSTTIAQMSADTVFSLKHDEKDNSVTLEIVDGNAIMKINEEEIEFVTGETFKHQFKGEYHAI
ncbi:hypothetical protein [Candidatus Ruminimicrobiellum ovillum]|uniref:hypothetical protein n=1 Tax=Candidatus Ruminimicrobiellum ovillum TaxID=1947927 RepID=UPI003559A0A2